MYNVSDNVILMDDNAWYKPYGIIVEKKSPYFYIKILFPRQKDDTYFWLYYTNIVRKMTEHEIKDLKLMLTTDKYNL